MSEFFICSLSIIHPLLIINKFGISYLLLKASGMSSSPTEARISGNLVCWIYTNIYALVQCLTAVVSSPSPPKFCSIASFFVHRLTTSSSNLHHLPSPRGLMNTTQWPPWLSPLCTRTACSLYFMSSLSMPGLSWMNSFRSKSSGNSHLFYNSSSVKQKFHNKHLSNNILFNLKTYITNKNPFSFVEKNKHISLDNICFKMKKSHKNSQDKMHSFPFNI